MQVNGNVFQTKFSHVYLSFSVTNKDSGRKISCFGEKATVSHKHSHVLKCLCSAFIYMIIPLDQMSLCETDRCCHQVISQNMQVST